MPPLIITDVTTHKAQIIEYKPAQIGHKKAWWYMNTWYSTDTQSRVNYLGFVDSRSTLP